MGMGKQLLYSSCFETMEVLLPNPEEVVFIEFELENIFILNMYQVYESKQFHIC